MIPPPPRPSGTIVSPAFLPLVAACVLVAGCALLAIYVYVARFDAELGELFLEGLVDTWVVVCAVVACGWGYMAIVGSHPVSDPEYASWLAATPWAPGMALPRGPVRLTARHAVICLCLTGAAWMATLVSSGVPWWTGLAPVPAMVTGAAIALLLVNGSTNQPRWVYATLAVVLGSLMLPQVAALIAAPAAGYLVGLAGVRAGLKEFPGPSAEPPAADLGWPYSAMLQERSEMRVSTREAALRGLLVFAGIFIMFGWLPSPAASSQDDPAYIAQLFGGMGCFLLASMRLSNYSPAVCPTLCWGHRVGAGRWIIPQHDQVFAVFGGIVLAGCALPWLLSVAGVALPLSVATGVGLAVFIAFGVGPRVEELHFTGTHAIAPSYESKDKRKQTRVNVSG